MIFRSPHPGVRIPDLPLHDFLLEGAAARADKPALVDGLTGRSLRYGELADAVESAAAGLAGRGFGPGDTLAICSPNLPEWAVAFLAVSRLGGVSTTLNPLYTVDEIFAQVEDSGARFVVSVPPLLDNVRPAAERARLEEVFTFGAAEAEGATPFADLLASGASPPRVSIDPAEDLVTLPYSSGTTGRPKGVMLTHRNLVANVCQYLGADESVSEDDVVIAILPFFHIYGMVVVLAAMLRLGATAVTLPRFELESFLGTLQTYEISRAYLVPPIILALAKHPQVDAFDLSRLRYVSSGAAPLGEEVARACEARLGCTVYQGYGLTEASPVTHMRPPHDPRKRAASVGPAVPDTEVQIVDLASGTPLGPGERGEVWSRGPQVMKGYLNRPDATAEVLDDEGWLHTGDIGYVDDDGYLFVVDRAKELIKFKGYQVAPAVLEDVLLAHPAIADAAVVPSPDPEAGEVPKAFVVAREELTAEAVMRFVEERLAPHEKVRRVEFVEEIPKSASGKILRRVLVERERAARRPALQDRYAPDSVCFGCGPANRRGLQIKSVPAGGEVVADWNPESHHEAFPGVLNGGIIGTLLDCHCNWTAAHHLMVERGTDRPPVTVTAEYRIRLRRPTPSDRAVRLRGRVVESSGDRVRVEAQLESGDHVTAICEGTFIAVGEGHPAHDAW